MTSHGSHRTVFDSSDRALSSSPSSPQSASARRYHESRHAATSPTYSPPFSVTRSLGRKPSVGSSLGGTASSPPGGNWIQHSGSMWPEGQFSASTNARISSPLVENALEQAPEEQAPCGPSMAPDVVNSIWVDSPPIRSSPSPGAANSPAGATGAQGSPVLSPSGESPADKVNLGFPRLSSLSLSASPPVVGDAGQSSPSGAGSVAASMSTSPRGSPRASHAVSSNPPDSPPKVRSNIALPPRSGYSLSDDSDSLRSETDGSNGSGLSSSGSGSETEADGNSNEDDDEDAEDSSARLRNWQMARQAAATSGHADAPRHAKDASYQREAIEDEDTSNDADAEDEVSRDVSPKQAMGPFAARGLDDMEDTPMAEFVQEPALDPVVTDSPTLPETESLDEGLSSLERIFLFAKSDMAYHRVLVSRCLAEWIREVDLTDAVEYVIPLLNELATDEIEVSAVFAPELGRLMWFFFRNCPLAELGEAPPEPRSDEEIIPRPKLPVGIFTPLLCSLLLNPNSAVSGATQASIVEYFLRTKQFDEAVDGMPSDSSPEALANADEVRTTDLIVQGTAREGKMVPLAPYEFGRAAREAVLNELFDNVAIAISRFDPANDARSLQSDEQAVDKQSAPGTSLGAASEGLLGRSLDHGQYDEESALGRMMSVNLLAAITVEGGFTIEQLALRVVPEITNWPLDPAFFVRKEVAAAIGIIGKALVAQTAEQGENAFDYATTDAPQRLLTAVNRVLLDHVWQVRQAACYSLPGIFSLQPAGADRRRDLVIIMRALNQDVSPNVQLAAFEMIGEVIYLFHEDPAGVPPELVHLFLGQPMQPPKDGAPEDDTGDLLSNADKSLIVAFNFPAVVLTMGAAQWETLRELYLRLTHHTSENVRNSLGASLHEIAKLIGAEAANRDLVPVAEMLLRDTCTDVTATLLEHIDEFWLRIPTESAKAQLKQLPMLWLSQYSHDWRLRESVAKHIPALAPSLLLADEDGCLVTLLLLALNDPVNALRDVGVHAVPVVYATFSAHDEAIADGFLSMLCDLVDAAAYRQRVTFLHVVNALVAHGLSRERFESLILHHLVRLAHDPVVDVRIALARTVRQVWHSADLYPDAEHPPALRQLVAALRHHACRDVAQPVADLLSNETCASINSALLPHEPPREPRTLEFGPARSLLDTTTIPWRGNDTHDTPAAAHASAEPLAMDQDP